MGAEDWESLVEVAKNGNIDTMTVDAVRFKDGEQLKTFCAAFKYTKSWRIERLRLPDYMEAGAWSALGGALGKGKVESVKVNKLKLGATDGEVRTSCRVLSFVTKWTVNWLVLPENMTALGWEVLSQVVSKGKVNIVTVNKAALRLARDQDIEALWRVTDSCWENSGDHKRFAYKSEGGAGLQKLLLIKVFGAL